MISSLLAMSAFALIGSITPGPVNVLALSHGSTKTMGRSLAFVLGASLSYALVVWLMGTGAQHLLIGNPVLVSATQWMGGSYLLYLAWRMHSGLNMDVTVRELAQNCDMSPSQFTRRFKGAMGVAPAEYMQNLRVNGARRLIARGASLAEAAHAVGFADQAHMQRAFKVRHAMTPGCYAPPRNVPPGH